MIGINDSDLCTFCREESETIEHLLVTCKHIEQLWRDICIWFIRSGYLQLDHLDGKQIILGIQSTDIIINHIVLITKFVIYRCKLNNRIPTFPIVKAYVKYVMKIEKYIAYTNQKNDFFLGKWSAFMSSLI